ncbi:MAG TPA: hypothetical protein DC049_01195, partial [Spirochaetia bacterium]|nr:hypothetical protein [Spirochaetia bacterium]
LTFILQQTNQFQRKSVNQNHNNIYDILFKNNPGFYLSFNSLYLLIAAYNIPFDFSALSSQETRAPPFFPNLHS